jgi:hypothetical protein
MARGAIKGTSVRDLAIGSSQYPANGESEFSRNAAHRSRNIPETRPRRKVPTDTLDFLAMRIKKLRVDISCETNAVRRARLLKDFNLKSALAARLVIELEENEAWNSDATERLPGEDGYERDNG